MIFWLKMPGIRNSNSILYEGKTHSRYLVHCHGQCFCHFSPNKTNSFCFLFFYTCYISPYLKINFILNTFFWWHAINSPKGNLKLSVTKGISLALEMLHKTLRNVKLYPTEHKSSIWVEIMNWRKIYDTTYKKKLFIRTYYYILCYLKNNVACSKWTSTKVSSFFRQFMDWVRRTIVLNICMSFGSKACTAVVKVKYSRIS